MDGALQNEDESRVGACESVDGQVLAFEKYSPRLCEDEEPGWALAAECNRPIKEWLDVERDGEACSLGSHRLVWMREGMKVRCKGHKGASSFIHGGLEARTR